MRNVSTIFYKQIETNQIAAPGTVGMPLYDVASFRMIGRHTKNDLKGMDRK